MTSMFVPPQRPSRLPAERNDALEPREDEPPGQADLPSWALRVAIKADPANRFFLSVVAAAAAGSMIAALFHDGRAALVTSIVVFQGAIVASVFSRLNGMEPGAFKLPALTLLWVTMLAFIATVIFVVSSSFFDWPLQWKGWLNSLVMHTPVVATDHTKRPSSALTPDTSHPDIDGSGVYKDHVPSEAPNPKHPRQHPYPLPAIPPAYSVSRQSPGARPAELAIHGDAAPRVPFASPFSQQLTVAGTNGPLKWSLAGEGQGLTIDADGVLSGTLSAPAVRQITVHVADGSHAAGELHLTLTPVLSVCENLRPDGAAAGVIAAAGRLRRASTA